MGTTEKRYCDWNGEELGAAAFRLSLFDLSSGSAETVHLDLCGACYTKWQTALKKRRDEISAAWVLDPKEIVPLDPTLTGGI